MRRSLQVHPARAGFAASADAVEVPPGARCLYVSGQFGMAADGTVPRDTRAQCEEVWRNLGTTLEAAGMGLGHLVMLHIYLTDPQDLPAVREIKDRMLAGRHVASTILGVAALAPPDWHVEIGAVAAGT